MKTFKSAALAISVALCAQFCFCACGGQDNKGSARVVVLLGQSNMEGFSRSEYLTLSGVSEEKYAEYSKGYEDIKISYFSPRNTAQSSHGAFKPTALGQGGQKSCFGPEVGIAEYLSEKGYDSVFLVKYSYAGTSLFENWRPPTSGIATGKLYVGAVEYVKDAVKLLSDDGYLPVIDAICWMQGESDADKTQYFADAYYDLQRNFIGDLRKELALYANSGGIGFVDAGISDCPLWKYGEDVNKAKYEISELNELNEYFSTIEHSLEYGKEPYGNADIAHFDSVSEIQLGRLFGQKLQKFLDRKAQ